MALHIMRQWPRWSSQGRRMGLRWMARGQAPWWDMQSGREGDASSSKNWNKTSWGAQFRRVDRSGGKDPLDSPGWLSAEETEQKAREVNNIGLLDEDERLLGEIRAGKWNHGKVPRRSVADEEISVMDELRWMQEEIKKEKKMDKTLLELAMTKDGLMKGQAMNQFLALQRSRHPAGMEGLLARARMFGMYIGGRGAKSVTRGKKMFMNGRKMGPKGRWLGVEYAKAFLESKGEVSIPANEEDGGVAVLHRGILDTLGADASSLIGVGGQLLESRSPEVLHALEKVDVSVWEKQLSDIQKTQNTDDLRAFLEESKRGMWAEDARDRIEEVGDDGEDRKVDEEEESLEKEAETPVGGVVSFKGEDKWNPSDVEELKMRAKARQEMKDELEKVYDERNLEAEKEQREAKAQLAKSKKFMDKSATPELEGEERPYMNSSDRRGSDEEEEEIEQFKLLVELEKLGLMDAPGDIDHERYGWWLRKRMHHIRVLAQQAEEAAMQGDWKKTVAAVRKRQWCEVKVLEDVYRSRHMVYERRHRNTFAKEFLMFRFKMPDLPGKGQRGHLIDSQRPWFPQVAHHMRKTMEAHGPIPERHKSNSLLRREKAMRAKYRQYRKQFVYQVQKSLWLHKQGA